MNNNNYMLLSMKLTIALVTISFIILGYYLNSSDPFLSLASYGLAVIVLLLGSRQIYSKRTKLGKGEIISDELSQMLAYKSGYLTYTTSILVWLLIGSFIDSVENPRFLIYLGLLFLFLFNFLIFPILKRQVVK